MTSTAIQRIEAELERRSDFLRPNRNSLARRLRTNSDESIKRWEKENELMYAMVEDEAEWLSNLFPDAVITPETFFYALEDGIVLCRLVNYIQETAESYAKKYNISVPCCKLINYHSKHQKTRNKELKLFFSRENVQAFLDWCRTHKFPEPILFESNDVVEVDEQREGCREVVICLMNVARYARSFGATMVPKLIEMEEEIELEENQERESALHQAIEENHPQIITFENDIVDLEIPSPRSVDSGVDSADHCEWEFCLAEELHSNGYTNENLETVNIETSEVSVEIHKEVYVPEEKSELDRQVSKKQV